MREDGVEPLGIEVVIDHRMPGGPQLLDRRLDDGVTEASRMLMCDDGEDFHGSRWILDFGGGSTVCCW